MLTLTNIGLFLICIALLGLLFMYFSKRVNQKRKENLNIVKHENEIKFYLSDDLFISKSVDNNVSLENTIRHVVANDIVCLDKSVRKISLINFHDKKFEKELNEILRKSASH